MLKLNRGDQAKQCFMEALALDVKCFEAFDQLVSGEMMTADEGMSAYQRTVSAFRPYN
jgi:anaphase-promoting complex subunit 6